MNSDDILKKINSVYARGQTKVTLSKATEAVKTNVALKLINENKDKKALFVVPSAKEVEYLKNTIMTTSKLDIKKYISNIKFITYSELKKLPSDDLKNMDIDLLIINEIKSSEKADWKVKINELIKYYPKMLLLNMVTDVPKKIKQQVDTDSWEYKYSLAKTYFEKYGNLDAKFKFKTSNGIDYDENGISLGVWLNTQRQNYKKGKLSKEKIKLLEKLNMRFETKSYKEKWYSMYLLAKAYFEENGDLEVPPDFKTINGVDKDENGYKLGIWIINQRQRNRMNKLPEEKVLLLKNIGMRFERNYKSYDWEEMYKLFLNYYSKNKNISILRNFKTSNGIDKDEDGYHLGSWLSYQRQLYKKGLLSQEKINLLEELGIIWDVRENINNKKKFCSKYNIPYYGVESIPYNELYAKTMYLLYNNIPPVVNNKLHPIYNMSNTNMQVTYGVSLEELIEKYKEKKKEK